MSKKTFHNIIDGKVQESASGSGMDIINPATGAVTAVVDASGLWRDGVRSGNQVLSGIAHINGNEFLLTGKNWPSMFRVRIDPGS